MQQNTPSPASVYDDDACLAYIRKETRGTAKIDALSDDELMYVLDLFYDFYESRGLFANDNTDDDDEVELDLEELFDYVLKNIRRDEMNIDLDDSELAMIFEAEYDYTETLSGE